MFMILKKCFGGVVPVSKKLELESQVEDFNYLKSVTGFKPYRVGPGVHLSSDTHPVNTKEVERVGRILMKYANDGFVFVSDTGKSIGSRE
jgi:hypothetical protein